MSLASSRLPRSNRRFAHALLLGSLALVTLPTSARAGQDVMTKESAGAVKASFLADLEVVRDKFIGLADAFPQDKYTWRPMDGVRSVSEVLMLIATEGYGFAPTSFGGKAALSREEMGKLGRDYRQGTGGRPSESIKAYLKTPLTNHDTHGRSR